MSLHLLLLFACLLGVGVDLVHAGYNQSFNPIDSPSVGDVAVPGSTFLVVWESSTTGLVSLFVHNYAVATGNVIADSIDASLGMYDWNVPAAWVANSTGLLDPFQYEMRIYEGSLGLTTYNITPFENRQYSYSQGYFAITNDDGLVGPVVSVDVSVPTVRPSHTRLRGATQTTTSTSSGTSNLKSGAATRVPTFLSVVSTASRSGSSSYWGPAMAFCGMIVGGIIL